MNTENVVAFKKASKKPVVIDGRSYIPILEFAERIGTSVNSVYQLIYEGKIPFAFKYRGRLIFEEKAIEPYKRSLMQKVSVCRPALSP